MKTTLALDVYGTLIDPSGIVTALQQHADERAPLFAQIWRDKQLEYTFRRGLMGAYRDFSVCTRQALDYTCEQLKIAIPIGAKDALMEQYRVLPPFQDVPGGLEKLRAAGCRMYAFSNGLAADVRHLLDGAGLFSYLDGIVSVDEVRRFKPDPAVYAHFLRRTNAKAGDTWLVSGNPFDIIGAASAHWRTAWLKRDADAVFDPWGIEPTRVIRGLDALLEVV